MRSRPWFKKIFNSVFTKMVVIIFIAGISINVALWGFFWAYRAMAGRPFHSKIHHYLNYIIDDLGTPPSYERASILARQAAVQIHFQGSDDSWSTSPEPMDYRRVHFRTWHDKPNIRAGMSHGRFYIELHHDKGDFIFELSGEYEKNPALRAGFFVGRSKLQIYLLPSGIEIPAAIWIIFRASTFLPEKTVGWASWLR